MSPQQPATAKKAPPVAPYHSTACRIGSHDQCTHAEPKMPPAGVPVMYEVCACHCHSGGKS